MIIRIGFAIGLALSSAMVFGGLALTVHTLLLLSLAAMIGRAGSRSKRYQDTVLAREIKQGCDVVLAAAVAIVLLAVSIQFYYSARGFGLWFRTLNVQ